LNWDINPAWLILTCVYYRGKTVFVIHVDDKIFTGPDREEMEGLFKELQVKFNITDKGDLTEYLGALLEKQPDGRTKLSQPQLIEQILNDLWFNDKTKSKPTPTPGGQFLERELNAKSERPTSWRSPLGQTLPWL
jgi:hypothetical protein